MSYEWNLQAPPLFCGTRWAWDPWGPLQTPREMLQAFTVLTSCKNTCNSLFLYAKSFFFKSLKSTRWSAPHLSIYHQKCDFFFGSEEVQRSTYMIRLGKFRLGLIGLDFPIFCDRFFFHLLIVDSIYSLDQRLSQMVLKTSSSLQRSELYYAENIKW